MRSVLRLTVAAVAATALLVLTPATAGADDPEPPSFNADCVYFSASGGYGARVCRPD